MTSDGPVPPGPSLAFHGGNVASGGAANQL